MEEKPGAAAKLAYQLFVIFNKKTPAQPTLDLKVGYSYFNLEISNIVSAGGAGPGAADVQRRAQTHHQTTVPGQLRGAGGGIQAALRRKSMHDASQTCSLTCGQEQRAARAEVVDAERIEAARRVAHQQILDKERDARKKFEEVMWW